MSATIPQSASTTHAAPIVVSFHKYLPLAVVYLLFNNFLLPFGLLYTTILTPIFYFWLLRKCARHIILKFVVVSAPFVVAHLLLGIQLPGQYLRSYALLLLTYITVYAFYMGLSRTKPLNSLVETLIVLNAVFAGIAVVAKHTPLGPLLWIRTVLSNEDPATLRLALLSYEPSAYAVLLVPLLVFATFRAIISPGAKTIFQLFMVAVPFFLSGSLGGFGTVLLALGIASLVFRRDIMKLKSAKILAALAGLALFAAVLQGNILTQRAGNALTGQDASTSFRTEGSFALAYVIAATKSLWWGVGFGQSTVVGDQFIGALGFLQETLLPNAIAVTFAQMGIMGVLLRVGIEVYLFVRTGVRHDCFRLTLFLTMFLFQFAGSFNTNVPEFVTWILAFTPVLSGVDIRAGDGNSDGAISSRAVLPMGESAKG
jgi:hypothetical protein